jgi:hypothetical protein
VSKTSQLSAQFVVPNTIFVLVSFWTAAIALWPIYQDLAIISLVAVATIFGSLIAILGARFRWSFLTLVAVTVASFVAIGVPLAVPGEVVFGVIPTFDGVRQLVVGVALGWKQLLTLTLPVGTYEALMVPALAVILGLIVLCLSLALRSRFGGVGAGGALIVLFAGVALGPESELWPIPIALTVLALSFLWLSWRRQYFRRELLASLSATEPTSSQKPRWGAIRTGLAGVLVLVVVSGAGVGAIAVFPVGPDHRVLRSTVEVPFDPHDFVSPLAGFRHYLQPARAQEVLFSVDGLIPGDRIRIATLNSYDGVVYSVGSASAQRETDSFTRLPFRLDQSGIDGTAASLEVRIRGYSGVWLPTVGQLESVSFHGDRTTTLQESLYYNDSSGAAAVLQGVREGDRYLLESVRGQQPVLASLAEVTPGARLVSLATVPAELDRTLARYTAGATTDGERLTHMVEGLLAEGYVSHGISPDEPTSRSGHSAERITQLLTDQPMVGDAEQYATAAAVMAQQLGFPARVVFGFIPDIAPGVSVDVRGESVSAWIEVATAQLGWIALDVVPTSRPIPDRAPDEPQAVSRPQPVIPPPVELAPDLLEATPPQNTQNELPSESPWLPLILVVVGIVGGLVSLGVAVALPLVAIVLVKRRRTRRRRRAITARQRMVGGWLEFADGAVDRGLVPPPTGTRREFAFLVGGAKAAVLAAVVDGAVFSPNEAAESDADKVWRAVTELGKELRIGLTRRERIRAAVSLRSLRRSAPSHALRGKSERT